MNLNLLGNIIIDNDGFRSNIRLIIDWKCSKYILIHTSDPRTGFAQLAERLEKEQIEYERLSVPTNESSL